MLLSGISFGSLDDLDDLELAVRMVSLVMGLVYMLLALGFFKGWGWVWLLTMIVIILGIIWSIVSWVIGGLHMDALWEMFVGLIIPIIILLYMNTTNVKAFFGKH
jgi:lysylphosphatidylglycerol synthetase-like protein (DUF2156 family)